MIKVKKRKAPSRIKYEENHPTVSCRVPREVYNRLQKVKKAEGGSFTGILKVGLGLLDVPVADKAKVRKQGYDEGYQKGYAEAENRFKVTYVCDVCGQMIEVTSPNEKEAIKEYMKENGWGHKACHEKTR